MSNEIQKVEDAQITSKNFAGFREAQEIAKVFSKSTMVPDHFRSNISNCIIAIQLAYRLELTPYQLMQSMYVVHGKPGMEGKLILSLLNSRAPIKGRINWEYNGEHGDKDYSCTCYAIEKETGERLEYKLEWKTVVAEGWENKNGSKWKTMPELMMRYRSAAIFSRLYFSDIMMGMYSVDELEEIEGKPIEQMVVESERLKTNISDLDDEPDEDQNDFADLEEEARRAEFESQEDLNLGGDDE